MYIWPQKMEIVFGSVNVMRI